DHISGVGVLSRRYKLPVFINNPTLRAAEKKIGALTQQYAFQPGDNLAFKDFHIHPFTVTHDAADPVGFVIRDEHTTVGYCTDTGQVTKLIHHHLSRCNALILEANHDLDMLRTGPYPLHLKQRIKSKTGHLSNDDAIRFAVDLADKGLSKLILAHVSETNNDYHLVKQWVDNKLRSYSSLTVEIATQSAPSALLTCLQ
ncbi:MAG: MBL fold metallo-hydrolase, partial [Desulfobulbus propionicus]